MAHDVLDVAVDVLGWSRSDDDVVAAGQLAAVPLQVSLATLAHLSSTTCHSLATEEKCKEQHRNSLLIIKTSSFSLPTIYLVCLLGRQPAPTSGRPTAFHLQKSEKKKTFRKHQNLCQCILFCFFKLKVQLFFLTQLLFSQITNRLDRKDAH